MLTITNARLFDGHQMHPDQCSIVIDGNRVRSVGKQPSDVSGPVIDARGMTVLPGLITCHLHPDFYRFSLALGQAGERPGKELPPGAMMAIGVRTCRVLLESGFTGYLGAGCAHDIDAQLKIAIAENIIAGPRIRACGHHIGTTADLNDSPIWWKRYETPGIDLFADGPDELRKLVREEVRRGVETIKVFASSGRGYDSRTVRNIARDELRAIVDAAHERGIRVRAHVIAKSMILECVELGVDIIDHADEVDEECIEAMVKAGTFWVPSLMYPKMMLDLGWGDAEGLMQADYDHVLKTIPLAQKAGVRLLVGDDYSGVLRDVVENDPLDHQVGCYGGEFAYYGALEGISPEQVLGWGTKNAGELLVDAPAKVGVIEPDAFADLIIVDGDPLADLTLLSRPQQALKAVMRDGQFVIDRLDQQAQTLPGVIWP